MPLWTKTPLIYSDTISKAINANVYLKLETLQPSHSFKYRGLSHFVENVRRDKGENAHVVIASGGNAAIAAACAAKVLGVRCSTFMPIGTSASVVAYVERQDADVRLEGTDYFLALQAAQRFVDDDPNGVKVMVPAYDHELVWEGHSSMIHEIKSQLTEGVVPDTILCAVGGGGLLAGILLGCSTAGWSSVRIISMETHGAACLYHSLLLNTKPDYQPPAGVTASTPEADGPKLATLDAITSRAGSLGARAPSYGVLKKALGHPGGVVPVLVPDEAAMHATIEFADEHKILVELACATAMAPAYDSALSQRLFGAGASEERKTVVFIVCGGYKITSDDLADYKTHLASNDVDQRGSYVDGEELKA